MTQMPAAQLCKMQTCWHCTRLCVFFADDAAADAAEGTACTASAQAQVDGSLGKRSATEMAAEPANCEELPESWTSILEGVKELSSSVCNLIKEEAAQRAEQAAENASGAQAAEDKENEVNANSDDGEAGQAGKRGRNKKSGRKGKNAAKQRAPSPDPLEEEVVPLTAEDVLPPGCLTALFDKAPTLAVCSLVLS